MDRSGCIYDLLFRTKTKKTQTAVSKHLGVLPNIRRVGNNATVWVKTVYSAAVIVYLVGVSVNYDGL